MTGAAPRPAARRAVILRGSVAVGHSPAAAPAAALPIAATPAGGSAAFSPVTVLKVVALLVAALLSAGCNGMVAGEWELVRASPSREVFALEDVRLERDGAYQARLTLEGAKFAESGTFKFSGWTLSLRPQAGGIRRYDAALKGNRLELRDGQRWVVLRRAGK